MEAVGEDPPGPQVTGGFAPVAEVWRSGALESTHHGAVVADLADLLVAVVDKVVDKKGTRAPAEAYLKFLYMPEGQEIAARHFYRPRDEVVAKKYEGSFPKADLFSIDNLFGGWRKAQTTHFKDGGIFDSIYAQ